MKMGIIFKWLCFTISLLLATIINKSFANIFTNVKQANSSIAINATNGIQQDVLDVTKIQLKDLFLPKQQQQKPLIAEVAAPVVSTNLLSEEKKLSFLRSSTILQQQQQPNAFSPTSSSSVSNYNNTSTNNLTGTIDGITLIQNNNNNNNFGIHELAKAIEKKLKNIRSTELGASVVQVRSIRLFYYLFFMIKIFLICFVIL